VTAAAAAAQARGVDELEAVQDQQLVDFLMRLKEPIVVAPNGARIHGTRVFIPKLSS
jgi:hypothetical protein